MMDKAIKYLLLIFLSNIFCQNQTLWDFGVEIKEIKQSDSNKEFIKSTKQKNLIDNVDAAISDPFIKPSKLKIPSIKNNNFYNNDLINNPIQIKSIVDKSYFSRDYQLIINILDQEKLNLFSKEDFIDLNYFLVESLYHTGQYHKAKEKIIVLLENNKSDRLYFLLSRIYESIGDIKSAKENYNKLMKYYPNSDYFKSAKIKTNILNTF